MMTTRMTPAMLKTTLHEALAGLEGLEGCAMVDWPRWKPNIGSHLVWLATGLHLKQVAKARIAYVSSVQEYNRDEMLRKIGKGAGAIFLRGGYFGDFWRAGETARQLLYEGIIAECRDNPVYLMPQSISFDNPARLEKSADILNRHPALTIFARDQGSFAHAKEHFHRATVVLSPDSAFHLAGMPALNFGHDLSGRVLYLRRKDWAQPEFDPKNLGIPDLVTSEWLSFEWLGIGRWSRASRIPGLVPLLRETYQRGLATPGEWLARQGWRRASPDNGSEDGATAADWLHPTWSWIHSGLSQLSRYRVVITNRLHGHIGCLLLGIPHVLVPGPYGKMRAFYDTWTQDIEFCRLVEDPRNVRHAVEELSGSVGSPRYGGH
jgi:pyruvyl transferase EpsO